MAVNFPSPRVQPRGQGLFTLPDILCNVLCCGLMGTGRSMSGQGITCS